MTPLQYRYGAVCGERDGTSSATVSTQQAWSKRDIDVFSGRLQWHVHNGRDCAGGRTDGDDRQGVPRVNSSRVALNFPHPCRPHRNWCRGRFLLRRMPESHRRLKGEGLRDGIAIALHQPGMMEQEGLFPSMPPILILIAGRGRGSSCASATASKLDALRCFPPACRERNRPELNRGFETGKLVVVRS